MSASNVSRTRSPTCSIRVSSSSCDASAWPTLFTRRELGDALPRLLHEARVLERNGEAAAQRRQQPLVGLVERVLTIDVLKRDHARRLAAGDERDEQDRLRRLAGQNPASVSFPLGADVLGDQQRLARLQHMLREAAR